MFATRPLVHMLPFLRCTRLPIVLFRHKTHYSNNQCMANRLRTTVMESKYYQTAFDRKADYIYIW